MRHISSLVLSAALVAIVGPLASYSAPRLGPHGGELRRAVGTPAALSIELVVKSSAQGKEVHVYGVDAQNRSMNLMASGYGGIVFKMGDLELPLRLDKVDDDGHLSNASERVEHYRAAGKFPSSAEVELEITVAFPIKQGTGKATFRPFANQDDSWR